MSALMTALRFVPPNLRRPLATVSLLGGVTAVGAGMVFITQTLLARHMGPADYGLFASSLVTVTMVAPLAGFGLFQFLLKAYGSEGWAANRWLPTWLRFTTVTTLLALALVIGWALLGAPRDDTRFALLLLAPVIVGILCVGMVTDKLRLEERYRLMALWHLAIPGSRLLVAASMLLIPMGVRALVVAYCVISLLVAVFALPHLNALRRGEMNLVAYGPRPDPAPRLPAPGVGELWSRAWAFGLAALLYPVFFQISTVLIKYLGDDAQAGHYSLATAVMAAIYLIPTTIYYKYLLAKLHRWAVHDTPRFWKVYRKAAWGMLLLGLLIGAAMAAVAPWVVPLVFGAAFQPVVPVLTVLAACVPIRFASTALASALLTEEHARYRVYTTGIAMVIVIVLGVVLIPRQGGVGAAAATVVGELALLLATVYCVRRFAVPGR